MNIFATTHANHGKIAIVLSTMKGKCLHSIIKELTIVCVCARETDTYKYIHTRTNTHTHTPDWENEQRLP